jgi:hypothetical protein
VTNNHRRHTNAVLAGFLVTITTLALGAYSAFAASPGPNGQAPDINVASGDINTMALASFPESYAGLKIAGSHNVAVFISAAAPDLVSRVNGMAIARGLHVTYVYVGESLKQLVSLEKQMVTDDKAVLVRDGLTVVDVHPDVSSNRLVVTLETPASPDASLVRKAQSVFNRIYGSGMVVVSSTTMLPTTAAYRYDDSSPFWGGDQISASGYGICSSGFAEYSSVYRTNGVLTAGHCFPTGAAVHVYCSTRPAYCCGAHGYGSGNLIGNVVGRAYPPSGGTSDFEITGGSSGAVVWGGTCSSQQTYSVKGVISPPVGTTMSLDGSVTGEIGGLQVTEDQGCVLVNYAQGSYDVCEVGSATGSSPPCHGGDSGGPAFVHVSGGVKAAGTIVSSSGNTCWFQDAWWEQYSGNLTILTQ